MPKTSEQLEVLRAKRRQAIMSAALTLFTKNGYAATSIDSIAAKVNMSKGSLYTYFAGKEDLATKILEMGIQRISEGVYSENITLQSLVDGIEKIFDNIAANKKFLRLYSALGIQPGMDKKVAALSQKGKAAALLMEFYRREFGKDAEKEMMLFSALVNGFTVLCVFGEKQPMLSAGALRDTIVEFLKKHYGIVNHQKKSK